MKVDDETLMAFHDGELDAETARRVRLACLVDQRLNARLEGLEQLGDFVRVWAHARDVRSATLVAAQRPVRKRTGRALGVAALALAGLALLVPGAPHARHQVTAPSVEVARRAPLAPAVAVESVDFGAQGGEVFLVESARSETTVVWLAEAPAPPATGTL